MFCPIMIRSVSWVFPSCPSPLQFDSTGNKWADALHAKEEEWPEDELTKKRKTSQRMMAMKKQKEKHKASGGDGGHDAGPFGDGAFEEGKGGDEVSGADVQGDAALLIRAFAYGTVGAVGLAGVCIWGIFKMAIWMAKESGKTVDPQRAERLGKLGRIGGWAQTELEREALVVHTARSATTPSGPANVRTSTHTTSTSPSSEAAWGRWGLGWLHRWFAWSPGTLRPSTESASPTTVSPTT